jgi:hypothetical protein
MHVDRETHAHQSIQHRLSTLLLAICLSLCSIARIKALHKSRITTPVNLHVRARADFANLANVPSDKSCTTGQHDLEIDGMFVETRCGLVVATNTVYIDVEYDAQVYACNGR